MRRIGILITLAGLAFAARPVLAQDEISRPIQPMEQYRFDAGSEVVAEWGSVQVGPYQGTLLSDPTSPSITLYCIDFAHGISKNQIVDVNTTNVGTGADFSKTRLGAGTQAQYKQAAYLSSLFEANADAASWSGIHAAIWQLMTPGFPFDNTIPHWNWIDEVNVALAMAVPWLNQLEDAEDAGYVGFNFSEWSVFSDKQGDAQEYLVRTAVVPEPATVVLLLTGMLLLFGLGRKRLMKLGDH